MEDYERQRTAALLSLRAFPRSIGMLAGAVSIAISHDPFGALGLALTVWFFAWLLKSAAGPRLVDINLWQLIDTCVLAVGAWIVKWPIYIALVVFALFKGAPTTPTLWCMGGLLVWDMFIVLTRGS